MIHYQNKSSYSGTCRQEPENDGEGTLLEGCLPPTWFIEKLVNRTKTEAPERLPPIGHVGFFRVIIGKDTS